MTFSSESVDFQRGVEAGVIYHKMTRKQGLIGAMVHVASKDVLEGLAEAKGYELKEFNVDKDNLTRATAIFERVR